MSNETVFETPQFRKLPGFPNPPVSKTAAGKPMKTKTPETGLLVALLKKPCRLTSAGQRVLSYH